jgi:hypothetical protein
MAKGNMLLGYARGKVGDLVFTRRNGEQVTRPRVRVVNNPKTEGQQIQRMIFASVIAAYSRMKSICDHSFEGVKYGADSQAKFMSENLKRLRAYYPTSADPAKLAEIQAANGMAFSLPNDRAAAGTGLIIAKGSLAAPTPAISAAGVLSGFGQAPEDIKISSVLAALGAVPGDQITIVGLLDLGDGYHFVKSRYVVDVNATAAQLAEDWTASGTAAAFDAEKTDVGTLKLNADANNQSTVEDDSGEEVAVGIIISRRDESGNWMRSDAILYNTMDEAPQYQADYALPFWQFGGTDIVTNDPRYLNNADI